MNTDVKLAHAQDTCDGLHRLVLRLNTAAVDIERGGSIYELSSLIAALNDCVNHLGEQLTAIEPGPVTNGAGSAEVPSNVTALRPAETVILQQKVATRGR